MLYVASNTVNLPELLPSSVGVVHNVDKVLNFNTIAEHGINLPKQV